MSDNEPWKDDPDRSKTPWEEKEAQEDLIAEVGACMDAPDGLPSWYKLVDRVPVPIQFSDMLREIQETKKSDGTFDEYQDIREKLGYWVRVAETDIPFARFFPWQRRKFIWVSTVFLGFDHSFRFDRDTPYRPVVFESMAFVKNSMSDFDQNRYCAWAEAEAGHAEMVADFRKYVTRRAQIARLCARVWGWLKLEWHKERHGNS